MSALIEKFIAWSYNVKSRKQKYIYIFLHCCLPKAELKISLLLTGLLSPVFYFFKSKPLQIEKSSLRITFPDLFVMQLVFAKLLLLPTSECLLYSHSHPINISMQSPASLGCCLFFFFYLPDNNVSKYNFLLLL